jgi:hypothetical protein
MKIIHIIESEIDYKKWAQGSKLVDHSGMPLIYYHSTKHKFDTFDINKSSPTAIYGPGLYFSEHDNEQWGKYKNIDGQEITKAYYLRAYNPLNIREYPGKNAITQICKCVDFDPDKDYIPFIRLEKKFGSFSNAAKQCGFDAIIHYGPGNKKHILVYDNSQILPVKSIHNIITNPA